MFVLYNININRRCCCVVVGGAALVAVLVRDVEHVTRPQKLPRNFLRNPQNPPQKHPVPRILPECGGCSRGCSPEFFY